MANFVDKVKKAESTVKKAKADHVAAVGNAEKALKHAESAYLANIKSIEKSIDEVEKEYSQKIDSFGGISLYRDHIKGSGKAFRLDSSVIAKVDIDGNIYASRAVDGGKEVSRIANTRLDGGAETAADAALAQDPAAAPETDSASSAARKAPSKPMGAHARVEEAPTPKPASVLYLTVESNLGRIGAQAKPEKLADARNFALQVSAVAAAAEASEKEKGAKMEALRSQLAQAKSQTADIDKAKAYLDSVEADNSIVVAAEKNLTSLMGGASRKDLVALSEHQLKLKKRKKTLILAVIAIVLIAIVVTAVVMNLPK